MASAAIHQALTQHDRLAFAFEAYRTHHASLGQASVLAHLPMTVFLEEARRAGVLPVYRDPSCD